MASPTLTMLLTLTPTALYQEPSSYLPGVPFPGAHNSNPLSLSPPPKPSTLCLLKLQKRPCGYVDSCMTLSRISLNLPPSSSTTVPLNCLPKIQSTTTKQSILMYSMTPLHQGVHCKWFHHYLISGLQVVQVLFW